MALWHSIIDEVIVQIQWHGFCGPSCSWTTVLSLVTPWQMCWASATRYSALSMCGLLPLALANATASALPLCSFHHIKNCSCCIFCEAVSQTLYPSSKLTVCFHILNWNYYLIPFYSLGYEFHEDRGSIASLNPWHLPQCLLQK